MAVHSEKYESAKRLASDGLSSLVCEVVEESVECRYVEAA